MEDCRNCIGRFPACHDTCPTYAENKAKHDAIKEKERAFKQNTYLGGVNYRSLPRKEQKLSLRSNSKP